MFRYRYSGWLLAALLVNSCALDTSVETSGDSEDAEVGRIIQPILAAPISATADTLLRLSLPYANDGGGAILGVTSASVADIKRSLIRFDTAQITGAVPAGKVLHSARIDLTIVGISAGWLGGAVDILAMNRDWVEGNSLWGHGASWVCAEDTNISVFGNLFNNCSAADNWSMLPTGSHPRPFFSTATDRVPVFTGGLTTISFDVTADVQRILNGSLANNGWILAGAPNLQGGEWVNFASSESFVPSDRPQLIIEYGDDGCPGNPDKGLPGDCGCELPDLDINYDNVADCFDGVVTATADTAIRLVTPFANDGTGLLLPVTSASVVDIERSLIKVSNAAIDTARRGGPIDKAYLDLTVAGIAFGWAGGELALHRMNPTPVWVEGIGLDGYGASWSCANDVNTTLLGNLFNNCSVWNDWYMSPVQGSVLPYPYEITPTDVVGVTWPGMTSVRFDVTDDINRFIADPASNNGWILQGQASNFASGEWVNFGSRESGAPPRLVLELPDACPTTFKPSPGQCGCAIPETDSDTDGTPDCVDECPEDNPQIIKGICGCGDDNADSDSDGLADCVDPCPLDDDPTLGGGCGCPSDQLAPPGTACSGACGGSGDPSGMDECDGAGHCGLVGNATQCPPPDPSCPSCTPYLVKDLSIGTKYSVYWYCPCPRSADAATAACASIRHSLAQIETAPQNAFVRHIITDDSWIGANDRSQEGDWRWAWILGPDGTPFWSSSGGGPVGGEYNNWQTGEPAGATAENCGAMSFASPNGEWQDLSCGSTLHFVCQRSIEFTSSGGGGSGGSGSGSDRTCAFLGNNCDEPNGPCIDPSELPGAGLPEAVQEAQLHTCDDCTGDPDNCPGGDDPTPQQIYQCETACGPLCNGAAEPPDPTTSVPCENMDDYVLEPTIFTDPPPEKHCPIQTPDPPAPLDQLEACSKHEDCENMPGGLTHCGEVFHCRQCDPTQSACPQCVGEPDPDNPDPTNPALECVPNLHPVTNKDQNLCIARKYCGVPIPECFLNDEDDDQVFCAEYNLCINPANVHTPSPPLNATALEIPKFFTPETQFNVPPISPPDPHFPEDPACVGTNCSGPTDSSHPWCHYNVTEGLDPQTPPSLDKPVDTGDGSILSFNVDPGVELIYETETGPLGMPLPYLTAEAYFLAQANIQIFNMSKGLDLIDLAAGARGGIHEDPFDVNKEVCGFKAYARAEILGMDILPEDVNFRMPDEDTEGNDLQAKCLEAVDDFRRTVDAARKAFADARELVRQYHELKSRTSPEYFSNGSNAVQSLCEQIASSPPRGFPVWGACETEPPVHTINRFIYFYNVVVIENVRDAADKLVTELDALVAANDVDGRYEILNPVKEDEQVSLFNSTFMVGPVPCNLEVLLTVQYGVSADLVADFRLGTLMGNLVHARSLDDHPVFKVGLDGGPNAGLGLSLFAGVGFDVGFASARLGIYGAVDLGHVAVPVTAWAGIGVKTLQDPRTPPTSWADVVDVSAGSLIPTQRLAFELRYGYRADLELEHILSGSLGLELKLKFFFFSIKYREPIISFTGLCPPAPSSSRQHWCDIPLFDADLRSSFDWGEIRLPMPFYPVKYLKWEWANNDPVGTASFDSSQVGEVFYDSLCQCIPTWNDADPPRQDCFRREDCCDAVYPNIVCYENPEPVDGKLRKQCTGCRLLDQNCNGDDDCCNPSFASCYKSDPNDPDEVGTCQPRSGECGHCVRDEDCLPESGTGEPLFCSGLRHCVAGADNCVIL